MSLLDLAMETSALQNGELLILLEALVASSWTWLAILVAASATIFGALKAGRAFTLGLTWWGRHAQLRFSVQSFTVSFSGDHVVTTSGVFQARIYNCDNRKKVEGSSVISSTKPRELSPPDEVKLRKSGSGGRFLFNYIQSKGDRMVTASSRLDTEFLSMEHPSYKVSPSHTISSLCDSTSQKDLLQNLTLNRLAKDRQGFCKEDRQDEITGRNTSLACLLLAGEMMAVPDERVKCPGDSRNNGEENISSSSIPSWASSVLQSSQFVAKTSLEWKLASLLAFEQQFGWDGILKLHLGLQWDVEERHCRTNHGCQPVFAPRLVRLWSGPQQRLLRTLRISETSATALDVSWRDGLVLTSTGKGDVKLWDRERAKCLNESIHPRLGLATALHINSTLRTFSAASMQCKGRAAICTWDYRCYNRPAEVWQWSVAENGMLLNGVVSNGREVYTRESGGRVWKLDTRMTGQEPVVVYGGEDWARRTQCHDVGKREDDGVLGSIAFWGVEDEEEESDENCREVGTEGISSSWLLSHGKSRERSIFARCLGRMSSFALSLC